MQTYILCCLNKQYEIVLGNSDKEAKEKLEQMLDIMVQLLGMYQVEDDEILNEFEKEGAELEIISSNEY